MEFFNKFFIGDRIWIDHEDCKVFVENILTAFKTKVPPKSYFQSELGPLMPIPSAGVTGTGSSTSILKMNEFSSTSTLYRFVSFLNFRIKILKFYLLANTYFLA